MRELTGKEMDLLNALGSCVTAHQSLPFVHDSDMPEFIAAIHTAQNIVLARPAVEFVKRERNND